MIGVPVAKDFGNSVYRGEIVDVSKGDGSDNSSSDDSSGSDGLLYRILYEDNDSEDLDTRELDECRRMYRNETQSMAKGNETTTPKNEKDVQEDDKVEANDYDSNDDSGGRPRRRSRGTKKVSYVYADSSDAMDVESDVEEDRWSRKRLKPTSSKKPKQQKPSKRRKSRISSSSDDDDEFQIPVAGDGDDTDDVLDADMIADDDDDDFEEVTKASSKRKPRSSIEPRSKRPSSKTTKRPSSASKNKSYDNPMDEFEDRLTMERQRVKINNNPQAWPSMGPYVDPVGVDPTHGIVERIVADQVRKVGRLLMQVSESPVKTESGIATELTYPIRLKTACSGTDAPSIALGIIKESLTRLCSNSNSNSIKDSNDQSHRFDYEHKMSCEIEPFKQAYIARNFPGVPLFPDITKLSNLDDSGRAAKVVDVYGRPQPVPEGDLFVAGTSCKDFSMLKTTRRKDIEDKGQSGETFLAAVEFLDLYQPPFAIFENVDKAPWDKMQEYIRGRIRLENRNKTQAITSTKRKDSEYNCNCFLIVLILGSVVQ